MGETTKPRHRPRVSEEDFEYFNKIKEHFGSFEGAWKEFESGYFKLYDKHNKAKTERDLAKKRLKAARQEVDTLTTRAVIEQELSLLRAAQIAYEIKENPDLDSESTAVYLLTDWHCEEEVEAATVNFLNEANLDIMDDRISKLGPKGLKIIRAKRQLTKVNNLVLFFGGDLLSGGIHEELRLNSLLSPIEAIVWLQERIYALIDFFREHGDFNHITVVCTRGNHGRMTKQKYYSIDYKHSLEQLLYNQMVMHYKDEDDLTVLTTKGYDIQLPIYNKKYRFHHGDFKRYGGGIGGLFIPVYKGIASLNDSGGMAACDFMGHFHRHVADRSKFVVNGSLIGYNMYARKNSLSYRPPLQVLCFIEKTRGLTTPDPIFF